MANLPNGLGSVKDIMKRVKNAKTTWELWRSLYQEAMDFAAPQRSTFHQFSPGQRKNRHIFDSTAVVGLEQFANRIQHSVIPPWRQWMEFAPGSDVPEDKKKQVSTKLEKATTVFFKYLNHSNFSTEVIPSLSDYGIGTGAIMIEEGIFAEEEALKFSNVPLAELYVEDLKNVWRNQEIEVGKIKENWPGADLPATCETMLREDPQKKVKIINGMMFNTKDRKYYHVVILEKDEKVIYVQKFDSQRLIVFRWHLTPGEVYGRGPILQVLADIRTINKVKQFMLENAAIQMVGLYTGINDGIFNPNTVRITPGVVIPVGQNGVQNPSLQALPRAGDLGLGSLVLEDLQANIRKTLFVEPLGDITDPVRSATEIMLRNQEMLKQAGASLGRLKTELIEPLVSACVDVLKSRGLFPNIKIDGKDVTLKQTSPLAAAEDQEDFQNSQVWFNSVAQLGNVLGPEAIMGSVKVEELAGYWADKLGVPEDLIRDENDRKKFAQAVISAAQTQMGGSSEGQPTEAA